MLDKTWNDFSSFKPQNNFCKRRISGCRGWSGGDYIFHNVFINSFTGTMSENNLTGSIISFGMIYILLESLTN